MDIIVPKGLQLGFVWGQSPTLRSAATFTVKLTLKLRHDMVAEILEECDGVTGDVPFEEPGLGIRYPSDFALFKPRSEILVVGSVYAPNKAPSPMVQATVRIGDWSKTLVVRGDRKFDSKLAARLTSSEAQPFASLPITYARSQGGPSSKSNPIGCGQDNGIAPNFELPPGIRPHESDPIGFGPISDQWESRQRFVGTYGADYVAKYWPGLPGDFDFSYFHAAPADQQFESYFKGTEVLEFVNLHPTISHFKTQLPRRRVRLFAYMQELSGGMRWQEIYLNLDTIWVDMDAEKGVLVWRGVTAARTPKLTEFRDLFAVVVPAREEPQSAEHYYREYRGVLERRKREFDSPADEKEDPAFEAAMAELEKESAAVDAEIAAAEAAAMASMVEPLGVWNPNGFQVEPLFATPEAPLNIAQVRSELTAQIEQLRIADPPQAEYLQQVLADLDEVEQLNLEADQMQQEGVDDETKVTREMVANVAQGDGDLRNRDLSKLDLSGLDLSGCDLTGADLSEALLVGTRFCQATLRDVDFTRANLQNADLTNSLADDADFSKAKLEGVTFTGMSMAQANFSGQDLAGANFTGCSGLGADFSKANLVGAIFNRTEFPQANFNQAKLERAQFVGAKLVAARFVGAKAKEINMQGSDITNVHGSEGADFRGANLTNVIGNGAIWEESLLDGALCSRSQWAGARFAFASLIETQLDRANLTGAVFDDATLRGAVLCESNLLRASLDRADFSNADLQASNLYGSGMWETNFHRTNLKRANLKGTALAQPGSV